MSTPAAMVKKPNATQAASRGSIVPMASPPRLRWVSWSMIRPISSGSAKAATASTTLAAAEPDGQPPLRLRKPRTRP